MDTGRVPVSLEGRLATKTPSLSQDLNSANVGPGRNTPRAEVRYRRTHVNVLYFFYQRFFCSICPYGHTVHGRKSTDYQILKNRYALCYEYVNIPINVRRRDVWFVVLKIVNVLIMTRTNLSGVKERTHMTAPDEKTLATLTKLFEEEFGPIGDRQVLYVHAPGRSEISGNHTDHEGGHVIAGSLDVAVDGIAVATDSNKVRVADEGYPTFEITLDTLDVQESEKGTSASLVRGMAHEVVALGAEPKGFDFAFTCSVPSGGGLSSSAAVEAAYGRAMETLWGAPAIEPVALAQMSQRTENNYYGKPCGLMDQAAVCLGGLAYMDFEDQAQPKTQKLELNFEDHGYALVLVKVGADHVAATDDYAAVPREMQDVAAEFGKARLCEVDVADFDAKLPELRAKLGDRACLRAVHYWYENGLVDKRWAALNAGDIDQFLVLTRKSGASSAMYLQNVVAKLGSEQPSMYALALAEHVLDGRGAVRIHGGGFGGTIQAFVPLDLVDTFITKMNSWLGEGSARHYAISDKGAYAAWL